MSVLQVFTPEGRVIEMDLDKEQRRYPLKVLQEAVGGLICPLHSHRREIFNENFKRMLKGNFHIYYNEESDGEVNPHFLLKNSFFGDRFVKGNVAMIRRRK
jgi:hypothetical protein